MQMLIAELKQRSRRSSSFGVVCQTFVMSFFLKVHDAVIRVKEHLCRYQ